MLGRLARVRRYSSASRTTSEPLKPVSRPVYGFHLHLLKRFVVFWPLAHCLVCFFPQNPNEKAPYCGRTDDQHSRSRAEQENRSSICKGGQCACVVSLILDFQENMWRLRCYAELCSLLCVRDFNFLILTFLMTSFLAGRRRRRIARLLS